MIIHWVFFPGFTLTLLRSIVIDGLQKMFANDNVCIAYIYCEYKDHLRQTTAKLLASLVKQQILQLKELPKELIDYNDRKQESLTVTDCIRLLSLFSAHFRRVFVLIDALDEHLTNDDEGNVLELGLLNALLVLQKQPTEGTGVSLFITSRKIPVIEETLQEALHIDISAVEGDVAAYIRARIRDDNKFQFARSVRQDPKLCDTIVDTIVDKSRGM